ncbi:MAG: hypothetical protein ABSB00_00735 [Minisyncoccia bacterium]|jgi:hypothetical protein
MKGKLAILGSEALKGTFIEELFEAMRSGQFTDIMKQVAPGEKVVGEMNELERALYSLCEKYAATEEKIVNRFHRRRIEPLDSKERAKLDTELESCRSRYKIADNLVRENIRTRFAKFDEANSTGLAMRHGHQIVLTYDDNGRRDFFEAVLGLLAGMVAAQEAQE